MSKTGEIRLTFGPRADNLPKHKELRDGLSVVVQIGNTLWVANDETITLERLTLVKAGDNTYEQAGDHQQFLLSDYLDLPKPLTSKDSDLTEADIEGLAYDGSYLWLVGSHSLKRKKLDLADGHKKALKQFRNVSQDVNRYLLARIPVVEENGTFTLVKEDKRDGDTRTAAQLAGKDNKLMKALQKDKHLAAFMDIPGKENGFDIEGIAVVGNRILLGLRGPVLRGWAVILEIELEDDQDESSTLRLKKIGPKDRLYRKYFLDLRGLGIRDLCVRGEDLLILAGPTMDLDGTIHVFCWPGGTLPGKEQIIPEEELTYLLDLPNGRGVDHAEGISLFSVDEGQPDSLLVVYDSASASRQVGESTITADVFDLPKG